MFVSLGDPRSSNDWGYSLVQQHSKYYERVEQVILNTVPIQDVDSVRSSGAGIPINNAPNNLIERSLIELIYPRKHNTIAASDLCFACATRRRQEDKGWRWFQCFRISTRSIVG